MKRLLIFTVDEESTEIEPVDIQVYIVTGTKNLRLPESFCEECNLFVNAAKEASQELDIPVNVEVYSWWTHFPFALRYGGYHPPVIVINGKKLCQGHQVPPTEKIKKRILEESEGVK